MNVPFHLVRRPGAAPEESGSDALYLPGTGASDALRACARLGLDPRGRVFRLASGWLVVPDRPDHGGLPGAVRLRRLARNLYLPVDAALVPALLDDEAAGLVRHQGLVFLPGGSILAFHPDRPTPIGSLLTAGRPGRPTWEPLPEPPRLADRIVEIFLEPHGPGGADEPEDPLAEAGGPIGTEDPLAGDPAPARMADRARLRVGQGMFRVGKALGLKGLAAAGASWMGRAIEQAPRLSEAVLGRQAASLRALLREFREGDLDRALRRALPLDTGHAPPASGPAAGGGFGLRLPFHDLTYSLGNLLGSGWARGPARYWFADIDVLTELAGEYRKAAEAAERRGDFRRAAFIYARLLQNDLQAANCLLRGGLAHDAAILFLTRLNDTLAAARAFEAAGEVDRALQLYRQRGDHEAAGDLLRRAGEEEAALAEYCLAAERHVRERMAYLQAGDLLATRAGRPDLARAYFRAGWDLRPEPNAVACAGRLAQLFAREGAGEAIAELLGEAEVLFARAPNPAAAVAFFDSLAALADTPALAGARDDLRDRALLATAAVLRDAVRNEGRSLAIATNLLAGTRSWDRPVLSDAEVAIRNRIQAPASSRVRAGSSPGSPVTRVAQGTVTAACSAALTGEVFLGLDSGEVYCYRPRQDEALQVVPAGLPVSALTVTADGRFGVLIRQAAQDHLRLTTFGPDRRGGYEATAHRVPFGLPDARLISVAVVDGEPVVGLCRQGSMVELLLGPLLRHSGLVDLEDPADASGDGLELLAVQREFPFEDDGEWVGSSSDDLYAVALVDGVQAGGSSFAILVCREGRWSLTGPDGRRWLSVPLAWRPTLPNDSPLAAAPWSLIRVDPENLVIGGLDQWGRPQWASIRFAVGTRFELVTTCQVADPTARYLAACVSHPTLVAAVARGRVDFLQPTSSARFRQVVTAPLSIPDPVACFHSDDTASLIVVGGAGSIQRVPSPR